MSTEVESLLPGLAPLPSAVRAQPLVTVIIPAWNAASLIAMALESAQGQSYRELEILVVDHASTDQTREVVGSYAACDPRVRLIALPRNSGRPATTRNRGLAEARGTYVAFLDADDAWTGRKVEDQVAVLEAEPDLLLVYSRMWLVGPEVGLTSAVYGLWPPDSRVALGVAGLAGGVNPIACSTVMARRDVLRELGGFDEDPALTAVEDFDLWLRVAAAGPIGFIPRVHLLYRFHEAGLSRGLPIQERVRQVLGRRGLPAPEPEPPPRFALRALRRALRPLRHARQLLHMRALETAEARERRRGQPVPVRRPPRHT